MVLSVRFEDNGAFTGRLGYGHDRCGQAAPDTLNPVQAKGPGPG